MTNRIEIRMPLEQEGAKSVVRTWLKSPGESVKRDEPLVEIETDKVVVEVPAPDDGIVAAIALAVGEEAPAGALLGFIEAGEQALDAPPSSIAPTTAAKRSGETPREQRLSPLVRRLIADHRISVAALNGTGRDGRITHKDVEAYLARSATQGKRETRSPPTAGGGVRNIPLDSMRKAIAAHMSHSVATAPHVTAVFEADFSAIITHRARHKDAYAKAGAPLTYSAYIVRAAAGAMQASPNVNSRWHDEYLEVFDDVNVGMGVALGEKGLIVPVIRSAQNLSLKETAHRLGELTEKARLGKLAPADVQGGTFTISNHGVSGSLVATPVIINQPQSAILGVGKLEKRVLVREIDGADGVVVRPMAYVTLTIDHRVLDGHQTNAWLTSFVQTLESWPLED